MSDAFGSSRPRGEPRWVTHLAAGRPDVVLMGPFMVYLLLLGLSDLFPEAYRAVGIALRGAGALVAAGWVAGQHLFNGLVERAGLTGQYYVFHLPAARDPRASIGAFSWAAQAILRIACATITVPIVEEFFWRAYLLRAFIDWHRFERVPLGTFTWVSFLGTALLSVAEHPNYWAVSILCWFAYNGLMYWKKSLLCLMITHGVTNLALYVYVIWAGDWMFW